jgi:hypothetical protein
MQTMLPGTASVLKYVWLPGTAAVLIYQCCRLTLLAGSIAEGAFL